MGYMSLKDQYQETALLVAYQYTIHHISGLFQSKTIY